MKILITGHKGFIGQNMMSYLESKHEVAGYEFNPEQLPLVKDYDWVIHLGAISSTTETDVDKVILHNYEFTKWLYNQCNAYKVNMQYASSASVYGNTTHFTESGPSDPKSPYATVARFGEEGLTDYRNEMLAKVMDKANFIERFGFGIRAIRRSMKDNGNPEPEFRIGDTNVIVVLRKLDLDALAARAAELACCGALFRFKRNWRANPGNASIRISSVSQLGGNPGLNEATASPCGANPTAKDAAIRAVWEYTKRRPAPLTVNAPVDSALTGSSPLVRMARIMCLLRELFGAEEGEMQEALKESFICRTPDEEKVREDDDREFRRLLESPPALSEMEADVARELDDDRMRALIGD